MSRSTERRRHKRQARLESLKRISPEVYALKGQRALRETVSEASYRLHLLIDGEDGETRGSHGRLGWRSFEDLLERMEAYGLRSECEVAIGQLVARRLCRPLAGSPVQG